MDENADDTSYMAPPLVTSYTGYWVATSNHFLYMVDTPKTMKEIRNPLNVDVGDLVIRAQATVALAINLPTMAPL